MSKRVQQKIKQKHPDSFVFTDQENFKILLSSTVGSCGYDEYKHTVNFIAHIQKTDKYIMYSLKSDDHYTVCNTIFSLRANTLKKYYTREDFKLFKSEYAIKIEEYIKT